jgi:ElaB/YqjD/DUF883 family membrane-anchored ribosome-binding protein
MERSSSTATLSDDTTDLYRELDRLKGDLRQIRADVATLGGDAVRAARTGMNETIRNATAQGKAAAAGAERQIASHPFVAVGAAFAIGLILGTRISRRP